MDVTVTQPETRANPVTGASQSFKWTFTGAEDDDWANTANWSGVVDNRAVSYTKANAPGMTGSEEWGAILFDGDLVSYSVGENGYKNVSLVRPAEGWEFKVGLFNGARVNMAGGIKKTQSNGAGCWAIVDETSKLLWGPKGSGNNSSTMTFYIAASEGVEFTTDFDFTGTTVSYNLGTKGSVKFNAGATQGTQKVADVYVDFGTDKAGTPGYNRGRITRKLVAFGSGAYTALSLANMRIVATDGVTTPSASETALTGVSSEAVGSYRVRTEADGIYLDYIGWSRNAVFPHLSISIR